MTETIFTALAAWQQKTFPGQTALSKVCHLQQEVKELKTDLALNAPGKELEFADCFILLMGAAAADGMQYIDIVNAVNKKMEINYKRKWGKPDADGIQNHIEE